MDPAFAHVRERLRARQAEAERAEACRSSSPTVGTTDLADAARRFARAQASQSAAAPRPALGEEAGPSGERAAIGSATVQAGPLQSHQPGSGWRPFHQYKATLPLAEATRPTAQAAAPPEGLGRLDTALLRANEPGVQREMELRDAALDKFMPLLPASLYGGILDATGDEIAADGLQAVEAAVRATLRDLVGHRQIDAWRCGLVNLAAFLVRRAKGDRVKAQYVLNNGVGGYVLREYLDEVRSEAQAKYLGRHAAKGTAPDEEEAQGECAAPGRLKALRSLRLATDWPLGTEARPVRAFEKAFAPRRQGIASATMEPCEVYYLEAGALDSRLPFNERACYSMVCGQMFTVTRYQLAERCGDLEEVGEFMVGKSGTDYKKKRDKRRSHPVVAPLQGIHRRAGWASPMLQVHAEVQGVRAIVLDFVAREGATFGDPRGAVRFLPKPMPYKKYAAMLAFLLQRPVRDGQGTFLRAPCTAERAAEILPHSLKQVVPSWEGALLQRDDAVRESGAWAGSMAESMSMAAAKEEARRVSQATAAHGYAAASIRMSAAAVAAYNFGAVRQFFSDVGYDRVPRTGGIHALATFARSAWANRGRPKAPPAEELEAPGTDDEMEDGMAPPSAVSPHALSAALPASTPRASPRNLARDLDGDPGGTPLRSPEGSPPAAQRAVVTAVPVRVVIPAAARQSTAAPVGCAVGSPDAVAHTSAGSSAAATVGRAVGPDAARATDPVGPDAARAAVAAAVAPVLRAASEAAAAGRATGDAAWVLRPPNKRRRS